MSIADAKEITLTFNGFPLVHKVYEKHGDIYYFNPKLQEPMHFKLEENLTSKERSWIKSSVNTYRVSTKILASVSKKIVQDKINKKKVLSQQIDENYQAMTIQKAASAAIVMQKFVRRRQAKKVVQAKREAAAPKSDEQTLLSESDAFSVASYRSENSEGSLKELSARPRGSRVLKGDEATLSSDSSDSTNRSEGSFVGSRSENSSSTKRKSERPVQLSDINSMKVESGSTVSSLRGRDLDDDDSSYGFWSGKNVVFGDEGQDNMSELSEDEGNAVPAPPPPTLPTEDSTALYRDLQAIVGILAQLKGDVPQLAKVREALNNAIEKTGGQVVHPRPEATVEPPNAGVAGAETSPTPKADDIEENIRLLREVQGKLESLLINHSSKMDDGLRDALVQLKDVVKNSITEATNAKNTKGLRERVDAERSAPSMQISPLGPDTQYTVKSTGPQNMGEDDDMTQDSITPTRK